MALKHMCGGEQERVGQRIAGKQPIKKASFADQTLKPHNLLHSAHEVTEAVKGS